MKRTTNPAKAYEFSDLWDEEWYELWQVIEEQSVISLYKKGIFSTAAGARALQISVDEFLRFLDQHEVPLSSYSEAEIAERMAAAVADCQREKPHDDDGFWEKLEAFKRHFRAQKKHAQR